MSGFKEFIDAVRGRDLSLVKRRFKEEFVNERMNGWTALHWASESSDGGIVRYLLSVGCDVEAEDSGRWRPIHAAALNGNTETLEALIEAQCSLDCVTIDGQTPLDMARQFKSGNYVKFIRLLEEAKKTNMKINTKIKELLEKVKQNVKVPDVVKLLTELELLYPNSLSMIMTAQSRKTLLDKLLTNNDPVILEAIKSMPVDEKEIQNCVSLGRRGVDAESCRLVHEYLLSRCIRQEYTRGFERLCTPNIVNKDTLLMGQSTLECVAETGLKCWVKHVLHRSISVDETWTRAENIAKKKGLTNVAKMISSRRRYLRRRSKRGFSRLHIAVIDDAPDMIEYLLGKGIVDKDEGDKTIGTALSLAYEYDFMDCVESLQKFNVNTNTNDWLGRSPLHWAICNRIEEDEVKYLTDKTEDLEIEDFRGLTLMDRSIINDCRIICDQLQQKIVELNRNVKIDSELPDYDSNLRREPYLPITTHETVYSLCIKYNKVIYPCLINKIDESIININDGDKNTLLHLCAVLLLPDQCSQLISKSANVHHENRKKNTPLLELLLHNMHHNFDEIKENMVDTINVLINAGASLDTQVEAGVRVFYVATQYNNEGLLVELIRNIRPLHSIKNELWHRWFGLKYFDLIKEVIDRADKAVLQQFITSDDIKGIVKDADIDLVMSLYRNSAIFVQESVAESILYKAATSNDKALFKQMIKENIHSDSCLGEGESLVHYLIDERKRDFIEMILLSQNVSVLLEKKNIQNKLPLHVAIEYEYWDVVDGIIASTTSVNTEDDEGNTPLSLILSKISETEDTSIINRLMTLVKMLILKSADIYKENKYNKSAIEYCTKTDLKLDIQTFARKHRPQPVLRAQVVEPVPIAPPTPTANVSLGQPKGAVADAQRLCEICFDLPMDCALNCGHIFCTSCVEKEVYCYKCRKLITDKKFVYL